jgi:head-tail adaptor
MSLRPKSGRELVTAGKRDRLIKIERYTTTQNDLNEEVQTWAALATVMASKTYVRASESQAASEISAVRGLRFSITWRADYADVNPRDRIEYPVDSGIYFDISEVNEIGRREGIEIFATARSDNAPEAEAS